MLKRINRSIFLKMSLNIAVILMMASLFIYGIVMVAMPQRYQMETDQRFSGRVEKLAEQLHTVSRKDADQFIIDFCIENQAAVALKGGGESQIFGDISALEKSTDDKVGVSLSSVTFVRFADSDTDYSLTTALAGQTENEITAVFWRLLPWVILIILIISAIGSFVCSRILAKPVLEISQISRRMSELDMTWHCDINRTDELGILANSLNIMAQKLNGAMTELENANQKLQEDIDKEKAQEIKRRAFFAAVSHELKTPITILKGQVESMIYGIGDYKNKDKYLPMVLETVERMENLVKEILTISKLNAEGFALAANPIDLSMLIEECLEVYEPLAAKRNIKLVRRSLDSVFMNVDRKLFEKVISNILSNAILYSPAGEKVTITLTAECLTVVNTGTQIPEEKLPELFEPLTRVEESRNKYTGGSGLGLYIVKTVLDLHEMPFTLENKEAGVCFTISFLNQN